MFLTDEKINLMFNLGGYNKKEVNLSSRNILLEKVDQYGFPYVIDLLCSYFRDVDEDEVKNALLSYIVTKE